jgi:ubiquinone/menaquinone biosynthesis C-methylase UbiE
VIEQLPFSDGSFDAETSTLMLHHLPEDLRSRGIAEIHRALKPGGRVVVADFEPDRQHGPEQADQSSAAELAGRLQEPGFTDIQTGTLPFSRAHHGWSGAILLTATKPEPPAGAKPD